MRAFAVALMVVLAACTGGGPADVAKAPAVTSDFATVLPAMRRFPEGAAAPPTRSNTEIAADFMELEFSLESGRRLPVLTRFEGPVTVRLAGDVPNSAELDLGLLIARLRREAGISISPATGQDASIVIEFLPRKRIQAFVPAAACFVAPRMSSWADYRNSRNTGALDWTTLTRRERLAIFVPSDTSPQEVRDCLHEEMAQALGPLNDLYRLSDSVFNDDNFQTVLTGFDMLILRLHYSPDLKNGMTAAEVVSRLPALLAKLNPAGEFSAQRTSGAPSRPWTDQIEAALGPRGTDLSRLGAAQQALAIAQTEGWADNRLAFSYFVVARLSLGRDLPQAVGAFANAARAYQTLPDAALHIAHVDMQMAAFGLSSGQPAATVALADRAIPVAMQAQNAALLATFLLMKAQALDQLGRAKEAQAARLDSLGWARYGFGSDKDVRARLADIAALSQVGFGG